MRDQKWLRHYVVLSSASVWARGYRAEAILGEDGFWPSRARCVMSDIKVDFNLIKIGVLAVVLRWGFPVTFAA